MFPTHYLLPDAALQTLTPTERQALPWAGLSELRAYIAQPAAFNTPDGNPPSGGIVPLIMAFDKPLHQTSFQLVAQVRRTLTRALGGQKVKIGHAGTLDPLATGVMVICVGRATKLIEQMQAGEKEYTATLQLGATTPSYDLEHPVDQTYPTAHITREAIEQALEQFRGPIMQVPPAFSACKVNGKRAYDMARQGQQVELQAKPLHIHELELVSFDAATMQLDLRIVCSKGTYIRALARDIGQALGSGAHLTALRRTRVGYFTAARCFDPNQLPDDLKQEKK